MHHVPSIETPRHIIRTKPSQERKKAQSYLLAAMANQAPSSSKGNSNTHSNDALAESMDILEAARKLMHLSGNVDNKKHDDHDDVSGKRKGRITGEEGVHQKPSDAIVAMIKKIFGNESEEVIARPKRKKKYRSLDNIYDVTTPINAENGTNATA